MLTGSEFTGRMKKKVIRVIARLNVGGPAIHVILLTGGLNKQRFESQLVSGQEAPQEGNMHHLAEEKNVEFTVISNLGRELNPLSDLTTLWQLYTLFRRENPDIVHTHTAKAGTVGRIAAVLAGVPVIVHTFHGHVLHGYFGSLKEAFFRAVEMVLATFTTKIIAVSESCRQDLIRYRVSLPEHIQTIHLGLELEKFRAFSQETRLALRAEWDIPAQAFLVGIIARMVPIKRHEDLFRAIALLLPEYPNTYFAVIGDGELRPALEQQAQDLHIAHRVVFTGFRNDTERIYQTLDLTVLTSANEGLPVMIIESLSSGTPVVATRVGGVPELIEEGETGFIVDAYNPESIAAGLIKAIENPEKTKGMGKKAQDATIQKFSSTRLITDIEHLYDTLCREHV
jgi:glycosyltransferase involved in cell wall biosynthesis